MVQKIGRFVLRKGRTDHISNFSVYKTIGVLPLKYMAARQCLSFWQKVHANPDSHPLLKDSLKQIYTNSRQSGFKPLSELPPPLYRLVSSYNLFIEQCRLHGDHRNFPISTIHKLEKDIVTGVFAPKIGLPFERPKLDFN